MKRLLAVALAAATIVSCAPPPPKPLVLNDVHSRLNSTAVADYHEPATREEIVSLIRRASREKKAVSISGGRHAMGGQQFGEGTLHINLSRYRRVLSLDADRGLVTVESGIEWPALLDWLATTQAGREHPWGIRQKQTGADKLSIGGALSCNAHGRGLKLAPIVGDVESFELILADGTARRCSRSENQELFRLAIGGYGLFGVITEVTLRLAPRHKLERSVAIVATQDVVTLVRERTERGAEFGDFQFKTDEKASDYLETGVLSTYRPVPDSTPVTEEKRVLSEQDWANLYRLAHLDKARAFEVYATHYEATDGQIYWSDTDQLTPYIEGLDAEIDQALGARAPGSLMISEVYVPRDRLADFLHEAREVLREQHANLIYGTVRFIERDDETFLPWARQPYACVVVNLRVTHDDQGIEDARKQFRALIDLALVRGGSYYLTYHRWARKDQVLAAYPRFPEFLREKLRYDPDQRFQSEWYRHYREMFAGELSHP